VSSEQLHLSVDKEHLTVRQAEAHQVHLGCDKADGRVRETHLCIDEKREADVSDDD